MSWKLEELCRAWGCLPLQTADSFGITGFSIDSRTLRPGELFLCLRGEEKDGHDYIPQALAGGAKALLVEEDYLKKGVHFPPDITVFSKKNALQALQDLAGFYRQKLKGVIIGVTGSNGKTSSKEMLAGLLEALLGKESVYATSGNFNNHIGLPLSLLRAKAEDSYVILEMGMNHPGEIRFLSQLARPHHALITSIANAHREFFKDIYSIAQAKLEILEGMPSSLENYLVYHALSPGADLAQKTAQARGIGVRFFGFPPSESIASYAKRDLEGNKKDMKDTETGCRLKTGIFLESSGYGRDLQIGWEGLQFLWEGEKLYCKNFFHPALASNLLGCLSLLSHLGFQPKDLVEGAQELRLQSKGRFERICKEGPGKKFQLLIDDSYNANPESFILAIDALRQLLPKGSLALCMGEMGELGEEAEKEHRKVAARAARAGYSLLALVEGSFTKIIREAYIKGQSQGKLIQASNSLELAELIEKSVDLRDFDGILVKGSRSTRMEVISEYLKKKEYS